ncbi:MAG: HAD hydrolase-like protein [Spirochaetales bacterium]|nr:HAD hydrolase-like protein [Spirochaetales bacterium]
MIQAKLQPLHPIETGLPPQLTPIRGIRALLFDVYGTLLISGQGEVGSDASQSPSSKPLPHELDFLTSVCSQAEIRNGLLQEIHKEHKRLKTIGVDFPEVEIRDIWKRMVQKCSPKQPSQDWEQLALAYELSTNPTWSMPGFPEIFFHFKLTELRLGIVSNAQFYTRPILETLGEHSLESLGIEPELCAWSYALQCAKPSPHIFQGPLDVLARSGISPHEVLYIGNDMRNDVATAHEVGCHTALFAGDQRSLRLREGEHGPSPDAIITDLHQIPELLCE